MVDPYAPRETMNEPRPMWADPRGGGLWWLVAAAGIGLLLLSYLIGFFDGRTTHSAAQVFAMLGFLALEIGLTLSAYFAVAWTWGARVALMLGAAFLALRATTVGLLF